MFWFRKNNRNVVTYFCNGNTLYKGLLRTKNMMADVVFCDILVIFFCVFVCICCSFLYAANLRFCIENMLTVDTIALYKYFYYLAV